MLLGKSNEALYESVDRHHVVSLELSIPKEDSQLGMLHTLVLPLRLQLTFNL